MVQNLDIYETTNGTFNLPPIVGGHKVGTATLIWLGSTKMYFYYSFTSPDPRWKQSDHINLIKIAPNPAVALSANERSLLGSWYNTTTSGQGVEISVLPIGDNNRIFFGAWYTYTKDSSQKLWFTFQGSTDPSSTVQNVNIYSAKGGKFDQPPVATVYQVGTATFSLNSSNQMHIEFNFTDPQLTNPQHPMVDASGAMDLARLGQDTSFVGSINTQDRNAVVQAYKTQYLAPVPPLNWTGSVSGCVVGTTSTTFQQRVIDQVNYYRAMAGVSLVKLFADSPQFTDQTADFESAALITEANGYLSHYPPSNWACYTPNGATAAGKSDLASINGTAAVDAYMSDYGSDNFPVGHRRWILYPPQNSIATGDTTTSNVLGVAIDVGAGVALRDFIAWPSAGYFPYQILPYSQRWSFSIATADFSQASVTMKNAVSGISYSATLDPVEDGYGDPTLVWETNFVYSPGQDQNVQVTVSNVLINGTPQNFTYNVIVITP